MAVKADGGKHLNYAAKPHLPRCLFSSHCGWWGKGNHNTATNEETHHIHSGIRMRLEQAISNFSNFITATMTLHPTYTQDIGLVPQVHLINKYLYTPRTLW